MDIIENINLNNKIVIIRSDLNVPIKNGVVEDDTRIKKSLKTIKYVIEKSKKTIILSHLGRIKSEEDKKKYSLYPVMKSMEKLLNRKIAFVKYDDDIEKIINENDLIMFENTRFFDLDNNKESKNDINLSKFFASFGDVFINDAFGTCHRSNASNVGISKFLPSALGFLILDEIKMLNKVLNPKKPFVVIMGGGKITDKLTLIEQMVRKCDKLIITGGMAFTFFKANGYSIGNSIIDFNSIDFCKKILNEYNDKIILPKDFFVGKEFSNDTSKVLRDYNEIKEDEIGLDIGPKTIKEYEKYLKNAETVFFNGPAGVFEFDNFCYGTKKLCEILQNIESKVIIGGGDSVSAVNKFNFNFNNISTGGGAALEYIEGKKLPGLNLGEKNE